MKRLLYITILLGVILMSAVSSFKWRQISDVVTTLTEINYLHGITGKPLTRSSADSIYNQIANNIDPHDSVWFKDETYNKDTTDSKLSKKANLYQPALVNPTVTTQSAGDNSTKAASTAFVVGSSMDQLNMLKKLGSDAKAIPVLPAMSQAAVNGAMTDGKGTGSLVYIHEDCTLTGVRFTMGAQGSFTADNYNGITLYAIDGTLLRSTTDDGNLFKAATNTVATKAFSSQIAVTKGWYKIVFLYNSSAQTTAPQLTGTVSTVPLQFSASMNGSTQHINFYTATSQNTPPDPLPVASTTVSGTMTFFILY